MGGDEPFDSTHAERELERINARPVQVEWATPAGGRLTLRLPPTVYPPREDTDLLLSALSRQLVNTSSTWLEIGCGSGVLSWWAAKQGCAVTACDVNPLAVACTRALLSDHGMVGNVFEGGPGPSEDGGLSQWGGDRLYDVVVWNMPYLSSDVLAGGVLGPMEEAALTDTDASGLLSRFLTLLQDGRLLTRNGVAFLTVSSRGVSDEAEAIAWSHGLAGRTVATRTFDDGETLSVLAVWKPYSSASVERVELTSSTNDDVMHRGKMEGDAVLAAEQEEGRGRLGRRWETQPGAMMASWLTSQGRVVSHRTLDQLRVGEGLVRLLRVLSPHRQDAAVLKWPNDLFLRSAEGRLSKAGGVLFEATTQGTNTRTVLGIGLNTTVHQNSPWSGVQDLGIDLDAASLHRLLHAMIASLFEDVPGLASPVVSLPRLEAAVVDGANQFGQLSYRGLQTTILGLTEQGAVLVDGVDHAVDDPEAIEWSIV